MGDVAFAMMVGPGEAAMAVDTLRLTRHLFPDAPLYVRDDATTDGTAQTLRDWAGDDPYAHVSSNDHARGYHGICKSLFVLLEEVCADGGLRCDDVVVKLDPDAVVAGTGLAEVASRVLTSDEPGLLGAVRVGPSGAVRDQRRAARNVRLDLALLGPSKTGGHLRLRRPFWGSAYRAARRRGYRPGTGVQAGTFAVAVHTLRTLHETGFLAAMPEDYAAMTYEEDFLLAIGVASVGHRLHELADTPAQWWVQHRPPVPLTPEQVREGDHVLIHPLKDDAQGWALRDALADRHGLPRSARA